MIGRRVINLQTFRPLPCCWDTCEKDGTTLYEAREIDPAGDVTRFVFCSERHKMFWVQSSRDMGNLPPGFRLSIT